ncbi:MAG TPA: hypothetical protein PL033_10225 [Candidatus Brocadiia bacterium]|nr:hypothetical protein [Candidatus Brocadiia bacterium]
MFNYSESAVRDIIAIVIPPGNDCGHASFAAQWLGDSAPNA